MSYGVHSAGTAKRSPVLFEVLGFLGGVATPDPWLDQVDGQIDILLLDHRGLEYKAAQAALSLMGRYLGHGELVARMSRLAREELVHFEQVSRILKSRGIALRPLSVSRYASGLHVHVRSGEPHRLVDCLLVGALIEARSCERFAALMGVVDQPLAEFYGGLLESEGRHYRDYLRLAKLYGGEEDVEGRLDELRGVENALILETDPKFRFHSGVPC